MENQPKEQTERRDPTLLSQRAAIDALIAERDYQRERWKEDHDRKHTPEDWLVILSVWLGKLGNETPMFQGAFDKSKFLKRLIQLGAIAVAAYESFSETKKPDTE